MPSQQVLIMGYGVDTMHEIDQQAAVIIAAGNEVMISLHRWGREPVPYLYIDENGDEGLVWENEGALPELTDDDVFIDIDIEAMMAGCISCAPAA